jgi:flagella basal body P-ring formation protein FlgA
MTKENTPSWLPPSPEAYYLLLLITAAFFSLTAACRAERVLDLSAKSVVNNENVLLKDIVSAPDSMPADWAHRLVIAAPAPGETSEIPLSQLAFALQKYPDMNEVLLRGQINLRIERTINTLSTQQIAKLIKDYIAGSGEFENAEDMSVAVIPPDKPIMVQDPDNCRIKEHAISTETPFEYTFTVSTNHEDGGSPTSITAIIKPMRKVLVARHELKRGHIITNEDISTCAVSAENDLQYVDNNEIISGMELNRALKPHDPILKHYLLEALCASKGDIIKVHASSDSLNVTLKAQALMPGRKGDRIICVNQRSKKRINATLTAPQEAKLDI